MKIDSQFNKFFGNIRLTSAQNEAAKQAHTTLRARLLNDAILKPLIVTTFLQGSFRRSTIVRPKEDEKMDVDLVVVTRFDRQLPPNYVLESFEPFVEQHYPGKWERQGRSIGIKQDKVDLDLVITAQPGETFLKFAEAAMRESRKLGEYIEPSPDILAFASDFTVEELYEREARATRLHGHSVSKTPIFSEATTEQKNWMKEPLLIPDRDNNDWQETHPLAQIEWTKMKNARTNGHFINIVKAIKWWKGNASGLPKYPKSYPLEHMVGDCCPDSINSITEGLTATLENMATQYKKFVALGDVPFLPDRGCDSSNVMNRIDPDDFRLFHQGIEMAAKEAGEALASTGKNESTDIWHHLLGEEFPTPAPEITPRAAAVIGSTPSIQGGFTPREHISRPSEGRFA